MTKDLTWAELKKYVPNHIIEEHMKKIEEITEKLPNVDDEIPEPTLLLLLQYIGKEEA